MTVPANVSHALDMALEQQVQAAFHILIQNCTKGEVDALPRFVQFVKLVVGTRELAERALEVAK